MIKKTVLVFLFSIFVFPSYSQGYWVWSPEEGKFVNPAGNVHDGAEEQYHYAMQFFREANLDEAVKQLENLLEKYPAAPIAGEAKYRLGTIYEEKGDYDAAFDAYKGVLQEYPMSDRVPEVVEREYKIGNLFLSGKKGKLLGLKIMPAVPRAIEVFEHIVAHAPYSEYGDKAQFRLGVAYRKAGKFDDAIKAFEAVIEQYPQSELVTDARFQIADTSFSRSAVQFRDERALDDAANQVDRFLMRHPDTQTSEKAARLRQQIDEKNAEKNYRIGLYYEKTNYLNSAMIYYSDVARRYPQTMWGEKASQKMNALKSPTEFISKEAAEIENDITVTEAELSAMGESDALEKARLERRIERLKERQKGLEKSKKETLESRRNDIKRRERELKIKFKKLAKKEKLLLKNPSDDLKSALSRWRASLEEERQVLAEENAQLAGWQSELGVHPGLSWSMLPFIDEPESEISQVRELDAEKYFKTVTEKKNLLSEKELLYKQYGEVTSVLNRIGTAQKGLTEQGENLQAVKAKGTEALTINKESAAKIEKEISILRNTLNEKTELYEEHFGKDWTSWLKTGAGWVAKPVTASVAAINPFDSEKESLEDMPLETLLERRMHLKEKAAAQKGLVDTLSQAFDAELALRERSRLIEAAGNMEVNPNELRKAIRKNEKEIRSRYDEIKDRHEKKNEYLKELDGLVKKTESQQDTAPAVVTAASKPFKKAAFISKAFLFGLPNKDVVITEDAASVQMSAADRTRAEEIQKHLEEESLMIEVRNQEIINLRRELEVLKVQASLGGGYRFRSAFVEMPYTFIREAVESANRLLPGNDREEALISMVDKETREFEEIKMQLNEVERAIKNQSAPAVKTAPKPAKATDAPVITDKTKTVDQDALKAEMQSLAKQIEVKTQALEKEMTVLQAEERVFTQELQEKGEQVKIQSQNKKMTKDEKVLLKELNEIEDSISKLIQDESHLEDEEAKILSKRMEKINSLMKKNMSKSVISDLSVERERIAGRLSEIELRKDFLSKEVERFKTADAAPSPAR